MSKKEEEEKVDKAKQVEQVGQDEKKRTYSRRKIC